LFKHFHQKFCVTNNNKIFSNYKKLIFEVIMDNKDLSFKQKIELYDDMIKYFKNIESSKSNNFQVDSIILRLKKWGRELKVRENYYDV
jgi:hypothetical protein